MSPAKDRVIWFIVGMVVISTTLGLALANVITKMRAGDPASALPWLLPVFILAIVVSAYGILREVP